MSTGKLGKKLYLAGNLWYNKETYPYLEMVFLEKGVNIIVFNDSIKSKDAEQKLVNDMMALIAGFSGKLYGMRAWENRKRGKYERN